jgi:hypothetical protein
LKTKGKKPNKTKRQFFGEVGRGRNNNIILLGVAAKHKSMDR